MPTKKNSAALVLAATVMVCISTMAHADCANPNGVAGVILFNSDFRTMQYCNDSDWVTMEGFGGHCDTGDGIVMTSAGWTCSPGGPP